MTISSENKHKFIIAQMKIRIIWTISNSSRNQAELNNFKDPHCSFITYLGGEVKWQEEGIFEKIFQDISIDSTSVKVHNGTGAKKGAMNVQEKAEAALLLKSMLLLMLSVTQ